MREFLADIFRSPIMRAGAVFALLFGCAFAVWPTQAVNDALDAFAIAGAMLTLFRFTTEAVKGLRQENPDAPSIMIVAIFTIVATIGGLRVLREVGLDLGIINSRMVGIAFGMITATMVFGIFLLVVAPPLRHGRLRLSPWWALALAIASGSILTVFIIVTRRNWSW